MQNRQNCFVLSYYLLHQSEAFLRGNARNDLYQHLNSYLHDAQTLLTTVPLSFLRSLQAASWDPILLAYTRLNSVSTQISPQDLSQANVVAMPRVHHVQCATLGNDRRSIGVSSDRSAKEMRHAYTYRVVVCVANGESSTSRGSYVCRNCK